MGATLHITNGNSLTSYLKELDLKGEILTWQEMLCEGPTIAKIDSTAFFDIRKKFLNDFYNIEVDQQELETELEKFNTLNAYDEIILWFEYDLFCHINLLGVLNLLHQKENILPIYLVSSGRVVGEKNMKGLAELNPEQLRAHYKNKIKLSQDDLNLAVELWRTYCGKDHNLFKPYITKKSSFIYLSNCLKAHLKRFPDSRSGLSTLEFNILKIIDKYVIKSKHHLLGYAFNYQGYYGYGDLQLKRIINKLSVFYTQEKSEIILNRKGHEALLNHHNFSSEINNNLTFGGVNRLDYKFQKTQNKLVKNF